VRCEAHQIVSIDTRTLKVDATWPVAPGEEPSGLAIDAKAHRLFSTCGNNKLAVLDATTGKVIATPIIGSGPDAVVFDAARRLVFVPAGRDGNISIVREVSADRYEAVGTIATQPGARTIALDPKTHRVYTVNAQRAPAAPGDAPAGHRGGRYVDGTFVVLIYAP